jgi:surface protein
MNEMSFEIFNRIFDYTYGDDWVQITKVKNKDMQGTLMVPSHVEGYQVYLPDDCSDLFFNCEGLKSLYLSDVIDTSNVTNMCEMFGGCHNLTFLDVSNLNTSNVTDMSGMFRWCDSLTSLDVSNFDTHNVTDMSGMFADCMSLKSLNLSSFNTSSVNEMSHMFVKCKHLRKLDLSSFDTSKVDTMENMFRDCSSLKDLYGNDTLQTQFEQDMNLP